MKKVLTIAAAIVLLLQFLPITAEEQRSPLTAKEFLSKDLDSVFPLIRDLKKKEADVLISQIREEARKNWSQADQFYFLVNHLSTISAIEEEQSRLKGLIWVYILGLALFGGFVGYVLYRQRKLVQELNELLKNR
ncbi:hypothetical protein LEP1GSC047_1630 [Leptospira inadai serovar Lyme str. 10]|uniref:CcmD family protein n=2 Tax=Leptospira inadai serovar Lyme TaxID=293084 RepID=V6HA52_9LEPT|nr:hypothetical protein [Leptospira inadai]EQA35188.1 hypothetical protein LEP1GSC047_1630 [Leptospira inadai serovar Lyme str. 10]PNV73065.1 hypothetical protein BES34_017790 [Leptospira inadai serovar Lyme]